MGKKCVHNGVEYDEGDEICGPDGNKQVCNPKGNWDPLPEPCGQTLIASTKAKTIAATRSTTKVPALVHSKLFPDDVIADAQTAQKQTGCLASVSLSQWAQESGFGKYQLHSNNPFGMKWYEGCKYPFVSLHAKEFIGDKYEVILEKFIAFPSLETAFIEHGKLLMEGSAFKKCVQFKSDPTKFIQCFGPIYATDPQYTKALLHLIDMYELNKFDT